MATRLRHPENALISAALRLDAGVVHGFQARELRVDVLFEQRHMSGVCRGRSRGYQK